MGMRHCIRAIRRHRFGTVVVESRHDLLSLEGDFLEQAPCVEPVFVELRLALPPQRCLCRRSATHVGIDGHCCTALLAMLQEVGGDAECLRERGHGHRIGLSHTRFVARQAALADTGAFGELRLRPPPSDAQGLQKLSEHVHRSSSAASSLSSSASVATPGSDGPCGLVGDGGVATPVEGSAKH